jgi:hypothetical protein
MLSSIDYLSFFHLLLESVMSLVSSSEALAKFLAVCVLSAAIAPSTVFFVDYAPASSFLTTSEFILIILASIFLAYYSIFFIASVIFLLAYLFSYNFFPTSFFISAIAPYTFLVIYSDFLSWSFLLVYSCLLTLFRMVAMVLLMLAAHYSF